MPIVVHPEKLKIKTIVFLQVEKPSFADIGFHSTGRANAGRLLPNVFFHPHTKSTNRIIPRKGQSAKSSLLIVAVELFRGKQFQHAVQSYKRPGPETLRNDWRRESLVNVAIAAVVALKDGIPRTCLVCCDI
ncbi:MAG: hypothetical protein R3E01_31275 [Pirellulaceae bacterium]